MRKTLLPLICLGTTLMAAATPVTPAYVPHNKVKGTTPTMTNIQEWAASIVAPGGEAKFTNDIRATADVGVHKVGPSGYVDLALSNKTLQAGMEYLVQSNRNPTVTYPSVKSMTLMDRYGSTVLAREVGTKFTPKYSIGVDTGTYEFGPKPTGVAFNEFKVYTVSNGVERLMSVTNQTATLSDGEFTVLDNTAFYVKARGHHTVGAVPSNNIGQAVPALQIPAGWYKSGSAPAATSDDATFVPSKLPAEGYYVSGYRNWYGIITNSLDGTVDSNYIRSDSSHSYGSAKISAQTYTKSVDVAAGTKRVVFAIPKPAYGNSYSKKITSIYDHVANQEVLQRFDSSVVSVEAASAQVQAMDYDVLIYENKNGITATRYTLTLSTVAISPPAVRSIRRDTSPTSEARSTSSYIEGAGVISPYYRQLYGPLDVSDVFYSEADLTYYCSTGGVTTGVSTYWRNKTPYPYAGQIVTLAADAAHPTNYVLKAKADGTYDKELIGSSGGGDVSDRITNLTNVITADGKWMTLTNAALNAWTTNDVATKAYADGKMSIGGFWYATGAVYINSLGNKVSFIVSFTPDAVSGNLIPHSVGYVDFRGLYASSELTPDGTYWTCSVYDWHRSTNHTIRIDIDQNPMDIYFDGVHIDGSSITTTLSRGTSYTTETGAIDINPNLWSAYALPIGTLEELLTETCSNRINACEGSLSSKADRVPSAAAGNFATFTSTGNLQDTGKKSSDFLSISGGTMDGIIIMNNQGIYLDGGTNYISYSDSIDRVTFGNDLAAKESCLKIDNTPVATYGSISNDFPIVTNAYTKGDADATFLGKTAKAADAEKLDGHASTEFAPQVEGGYLPRIAGISNHLTGELFFANTNCSISGNTDSGGFLSLSAESLHFIKPSVGAPSASYLEPDGTPVATSNMVEAIVAGRSGGIDESVLTNKALTAFGPSATDSVVGALRNTDVVLTVSNGVFAVKDHGATVWRSSSTAGGADENAVHYTPDSNWSDAEKAQARANIGAADAATVAVHDGLLSHDEPLSYGRDPISSYMSCGQYDNGWWIYQNRQVAKSGKITKIRFYRTSYDYSTTCVRIGVFSRNSEARSFLVKGVSETITGITGGEDISLTTPLDVSEGDVIGFSLYGSTSNSREIFGSITGDPISYVSTANIAVGNTYTDSSKDYTIQLQCLLTIEYTDYISSYSLKSGIQAAANATNLTSGTVAPARLPIATTNAVGAVKGDGSTVSIAPDGTISVVGGGGGAIGEKVELHDALLRRDIYSTIGNASSNIVYSFTYGFWAIDPLRVVTSDGFITSVKLLDVPTSETNKLKVGVFSIGETEGEYTTITPLRYAEVSTASAGTDVELDVPLEVSSGNVIGFYGRNLNMTQSGRLSHSWGPESPTPGVAFSTKSNVGYEYRVTCQFRDRGYVSTPSLEAKLPTKNYPTVLEGWERPAGYENWEADYGNVMLNDGTVSYGGSNLLFGKKCWEFGDSLTGDYCHDLDRNGHFMRYLKVLSGMYVDAYAMGGTTTCPLPSNKRRPNIAQAGYEWCSGQDRILSAVKNAEEGETFEPDIILYENINDISAGLMGVTTNNYEDYPWMLSQYVDFGETGTYTSLVAAKSAFDDNFATITGGVEDKKQGTVVRIPYSYQSGGQTVSTYLFVYFVGRSLEDFTDRTKWSYATPSLVSVYKGWIEFIMAKYKRAQIVLVHAPSMAYGEADESTYYYDYGTPHQRLNVYAMKYNPVNAQRRTQTQDKLGEFLDNIAKLYNIRVIHIPYEISINQINITAWYNENNVHPITDAYKRWAEVIYKELIP